MLQLSVIINTFPPKARELSYCLKALQKQNFSDFELIIVNDGIDPATSQIIKRYQPYFTMQYFERANDMSLARSRNIGARGASCNYLIFIDADILLNQGALAYYFSYFQEQDEISIWGPYGFSRTRTTATSFQEIIESRPVFADPGLRTYIEQNPRTPLFPCHPYFFAYAGNFAISKKLFEKSGGFNETFVKWGGEDIEFAYRLYQQGNSFIFRERVWGEHLRHHKKGSFYSDGKASPGLMYVKKLLWPLREAYFSEEPVKIISEWEKLLKICHSKDFASRNLNVFQLNSH